MKMSWFLDWQEQVSSSATSDLFIRVINLAGFSLILWMLPIADMVWGGASFSILYHDFTGLDSVPVLLRNESIRAFYFVFVAAYLGLTLLAILNLSTALSRFATWLVLLILYFGNYDISNGGWHILIQLHLLSIFLINPIKVENSRFRSIYFFLHNIAFRFIWIQIAFMYLTSGIHKLFGHYWLNGEAMLIVFNRPEYSLPLLFENLVKVTPMIKVLTWSALAYQISFPCLIWFRKTRPFILSAGIIFHAVILFVIGIPDFAIILIAAYSIFIEPPFAERILKKLSLNSFFKK